MYFADFHMLGSYSRTFAYFRRYFFKKKKKGFEDSSRVSFDLMKNLESLKLLSEDGVGVCMVIEGMMIRSQYRRILEENNLYVNAVFIP